MAKMQTNQPEQAAAPASMAQMAQSAPRATRDKMLTSSTPLAQEHGLSHELSRDLSSELNHVINPELNGGLSRSFSKRRNSPQEQGRLKREPRLRALQRSSRLKQALLPLTVALSLITPAVMAAPNVTPVQSLENSNNYPASFCLTFSGRQIVLNNTNNLKQFISVRTTNPEGGATGGGIAGAGASNAGASNTGVSAAGAGTIGTGALNAGSIIDASPTINQGPS